MKRPIYHFRLIDRASRQTADRFSATWDEFETRFDRSYPQAFNLYMSIPRKSMNIDITFSVERRAV